MCYHMSMETWNRLVAEAVEKKAAERVYRRAVQAAKRRTAALKLAGSHAAEQARFVAEATQLVGRPIDHDAGEVRELVDAF